MNRFITLMLNNFILGFSLCVLSFPVCAQEVKAETEIEKNLVWENMKQVWQDDIQFHGFLSQGLFSTSGNNVYGKSKDSVSAGLTEIGLNVSYQALNNLSFSAQGLYRRAGASTGDGGEVTLDFAFVDLNLVALQQGRFGIRGGRIKNPWGLYNETRDVAFTHPTIFLPLAYFERSRSLFLAIDGGQFYADYNSAIGDFSFKFNYGWVNTSDPELLIAITANPDVAGRFESNPSFVSQLRYDINEGEYIFALSYAELGMSYKSNMANDPHAQLNTQIDAFMLSGQYNGERFSFSGEYGLQWNEFRGRLIGVPELDASPISQHWYVQAGYRILDSLQATLRYDSTVQDLDDRLGKQFNAVTGIPASFAYTQDIVVGLRWDITPAWMVRAEYHRVHGTSTISVIDNPDLMNAVDDWNIYALQAAYRF